MYCTRMDFVCTNPFTSWFLAVSALLSIVTYLFQKSIKYKLQCSERTSRLVVSHDSTATCHQKPFVLHHCGCGLRAARRLSGGGRRGRRGPGRRARTAQVCPAKPCPVERERRRRAASLGCRCRQDTTTPLPRHPLPLCIPSSPSP